MNHVSFDLHRTIAADRQRILRRSADRARLTRRARAALAPSASDAVAPARPVLVSRATTTHGRPALIATAREPEHASARVA